jgi:osmotically-inducible protein OsmY
MTTERLDPYLVERVRRALAEDPRVNALDIAITVVDRAIFLRGTVATDARREQIGVVVRELLPDHDVQNDVSVEAPATPRAPERLA